MTEEPKQTKVSQAWHKHAVLECIEAAADDISQGFVWADTPEGNDYWELVYDRLILMAEDLKAAQKAASTTEETNQS